MLRPIRKLQPPIPSEFFQASIDPTSPVSYPPARSTRARGLHYCDQLQLYTGENSDIR